jgi:hypothetical protein
MPELLLVLAPNINSFKRFAPGIFAPTKADSTIARPQFAFCPATRTRNGWSCEPQGLIQILTSSHRRC